MSFVLQAPMIILEDVVLRPGYLTISGGVITSVREGRFRPGTGAGVRVVEVSGMVAAGFVDLHLHGGDGAQVNGDSPGEVVASLDRIGRFHAKHGTTSFLATTVSDTPERLSATVAGAAVARRRGPQSSSRLLGVHLEGPWIAPGRTGAQDPSRLRLPDTGELRALVAAGEGCVRMVTLAPELPGADSLVAEASAAGLLVAIGHTDADFETARRAFGAGARHVTHLFNAMAPLHHRRPGAAAAALLDERVTLEVIADLEHVHPAMLRLAARLAPGRLVAVSDAVPAAGSEPGVYRLGERDVSLAGGRVSLVADPATLAGSALTLDRAISNLHSAAGLGLVAAFAAGSSVPGRAITRHAAEPPTRPTDLPAELGRLTGGAPADIVVLEGSPPGSGAHDGGAFGSGGEPQGENRAPEVVATLVGGRPVWDPAGTFAGIDP